MQFEDGHPARQGVAELGQQQEVGGAGEEKSAGAPIPVHGELERAQQLGDALDLVEDHAVGQCGEKAVGVRLGLGERIGIVEADVAVARGEGAGERGLAALARAEQAHHRGVGEGSAQGGFQGARQRRGVHLPVKRASNCLLGERLIAG